MKIKTILKLTIFLSALCFNYNVFSKDEQTGSIKESIIITPSEKEEKAGNIESTLGIRVGYFIFMSPFSANTFFNSPMINIYYNINPNLFNKLSIEADLGYSLFTHKEYTGFMIHNISAGVNLQYGFNIFNWLSINAILGGGYYYSIINGSRTGLNGGYDGYYYKAGFGIDFNFSYNFVISLGGQYVDYVLLKEKNDIGGLNLSLELKLRFGVDPNAQESLNIQDIKIDALFSSLYKYYENNPMGYVKIKNNTGNDIKDVKVSFFVKDYMDYPTEGKAISMMKDGEINNLEVNASLKNKILEISEDSYINAQLIVSFRIGNNKYTKSKNTSLKLFNRNAITWDDDRKLASFVTPKDGPVKAYASGLVQPLKSLIAKSGNEDIQSASIIYDSLAEYGIVYQKDQKNAIYGKSGKKEAVDIIQYPRETLKRKLGDCDDLTVLYCALLEHLGIDTAFITVPGHIFMMFNTGIDWKNSKDVTPDIKKVINYDGKVWIPIEVTMIHKIDSENKAPFLNAWEYAAKSFTEERSKHPEEVKVTPIYTCTYDPVTLEETNWNPDITDLSKKI